MADVLPPPSPTPTPSDRPPRPRPSPRPSANSTTTLPSSRPQSTSFPAFHSSLPYALVRDFAYPPFHPMHYGPPPTSDHASSTPTPERRLSDPLDAWPASSTIRLDLSDPSYDDGPVLPGTSFGDTDPESSRRGHRKSRSYTSPADFERGRRRESARRSRGASGTGEDGMFFFGASSSIDPAGSSSLRHSRGQLPGTSRRDSHFAATLPSRSFHHSQTSASAATTTHPEDPIPLDAEPESTHAHSPQRASMGPEDEELFAGESLALYNFEPENSNELRLREGQVILVSYRHGQGWLVAEDPGTGEQGLVPEEYVRLVREIEGWDSERGVLVGEEGEGEGDEMDVDGEGESVVGTEAEGELEDAQSREGEVSAAMLASPPEVDHMQGLQMKNVSTAKKGGEQEDARQDSAHAER